MIITMPNPYPGLLIAFEGIDGCDKSTQLTLAANKIEGLTGFNGKIVKTKEPNRDSEMGKKICAELAKPDGLHQTDPLGFQTWCF